MGEVVLSVEGLAKRFGGLVANDNVTFKVYEGEILGLIGPNGAGKTTLFNCLTGFLKPDAGTVTWRGENVTGLPPYEITGRRIARTFQVTKTFVDLTVLESVMVGSLLRYPRVKDARRRAEEVLEFTGLADKAHLLGRALTVADRKRLEIARALATEPELLMLDEAMAGLNPKEVEEAVGLVMNLRQKGLTLIVVEHVMEVVMPLSDRIIVLDRGSLIAEGKPEEIARDRRVITAYLGEKWHVAG